jgi:hypothetical protein
MFDMSVLIVTIFVPESSVQDQQAHEHPDSRHLKTDVNLTDLRQARLARFQKKT